MRHFNLLNSVVLTLVSAAVSLAQVTVTEIDENYTQLDFGFHIMMVHFNIRPANENFRALTGGFQISDQERSNYSNLVKEEVLKLPRTFITRYVIDNVYILGLKQENVLGYHTDDLIIIEGRESQHNMRRTLFHEIAHEVAAKSNHKPEYRGLCQYFDTHRSDGNALSYLKIHQLYETGHSNPYAQKNAEEEFCELFADLMMPHADMPLITYVTEHPQSVLAEKVNRVIAFFSNNYCRELNHEFFMSLGRRSTSALSTSNITAKGK